MLGFFVYFILFLCFFLHSLRFACSNLYFFVPTFIRLAFVSAQLSLLLVHLSIVPRHALLCSLHCQHFNSALCFASHAAASPLPSFPIWCHLLHSHMLLLSIHLLALQSNAQCNLACFVLSFVSAQIFNSFCDFCGFALFFLFFHPWFIRIHSILPPKLTSFFHPLVQWFPSALFVVLYQFIFVGHQLLFLVPFWPTTTSFGCSFLHFFSFSFLSFPSYHFTRLCLSVGLSVSCQNQCCCKDRPWNIFLMCTRLVRFSRLSFCDPIFYSPEFPHIFYSFLFFFIFHYCTPT